MQKRTRPVSRTATLAERLEHHGWEVTESGCWEWQGSRTPKGYGILNVGHGERDGAHRVSFTVHNGAIPAGAVICHRCDNPPCINPAHLFPGSQTENLADMQGKGRERYRSGQHHGMAKLSDADVTAIRLAHSRGSTYGELAAIYGVTASNIGRIVRRQSRVVPTV
jgi:HNH endonuclease